MARYLETRFRAFGLEAERDGGSLRTSTPLEFGVRVQGSIGLRDERHGYAFARDYRPQGATGDGHALGPLAFLGPGRELREAGRDGAARIDLRGRIVLIPTGSPDATSDLEEPAYPGWWESPFGKAAQARSLGAAAVLLVEPRSAAETPDRLWGVPQNRGYVNLGIPVVQVSQTTAESLLASSRLRLDSLEGARERSGARAWRDLPQDSVEVLVEARRQGGSAANVIAVKKGRLAETIIVAACYDGFGGSSESARDLPSPGANDNASGTAALLALARAFASAPEPDRTLCFVAYAGRDLGGIGFRTVLEQSGLDRQRIVAVLDLASLGRPTHDRLLCVGGGKAAAEWIRRANDELPQALTLSFAPIAPSATLPGDLAAQGLISLGLSYGRTSESGRAADTPESLDYAALQRACRLVYGVTVLLSREATAIPR